MLPQPGGWSAADGHEEGMQYVDWLIQHMDKQEAAAEYIEFLVSRAVCNVAASARVRIGYFVRRFGSRAHRVYCLPNSDLDLVCEFGPEIWSCGLTPKSILEDVRVQLKEDGRISAVRDAIKAKKTIEFKFAELKVDFTVHVVERGSLHAPTQGTDVVSKEAHDLSCTAQTVVMLTVDWAKRANVCWDRKGAIDDGLKAIHWALLVIAWYKCHGRCEEEGDVADRFAKTLFDLFTFYVGFDFDSNRIAALDSQPFSENSAPAAARPAMWLSCPLDPDRNLTERASGDTIHCIRKALEAARHCIATSPHSFWQQSWQRWEPYRDRQYTFDRQSFLHMSIEGALATDAHPPASH